MVNEVAGIGEWIDSSQAREDVNKVSEQAVKKAQSDEKKAKQVQQQIQKSKQENNKIAAFLTFLLRDLTNDALITALYNAFFKVYHEKKSVTYLRKSINSVVVVGFFAPFYWDKIQEYQLQDYFSDLFDAGTVLDVHKYLQYIKQLSRKHHDNIPIAVSNLVTLLVEIIREYDLNTHHTLAHKDTEELKLFFMQELWLQEK